MPSRRHTQKIKHTLPTLRSTYGEVIVKKGTSMYHTSDEPFQIRPDKKLLFMTFHPADWAPHSNYITKITLQKDISLLFMIDTITPIGRISPLLNILIRKPRRNLNKQFDINNICYIKYLKTEHYNGWFSSIEGKVEVEVAIINDPVLYSYSESEPLPSNEEFWDKYYPITTVQYPIILKINERYREYILRYIALGKSFNNEYIFHRVLQNAIIRYIGPKTNNHLFWKC